MNISGVVRKGIMFGLLESMRVCPGCGGILPPDCSFCPSCGFDVSGADAFIEKRLKETFPPSGEGLEECTYPEYPRGPGRGLGRNAGLGIGQGIGIRRLIQRNPRLGLLSKTATKDAEIEADSDIVVSDEDVHVTVKDVKDVMKSLRRREKRSTAHVSAEAFGDIDLTIELEAPRGYKGQDAYAAVELGVDYETEPEEPSTGFRGGLSVTDVRIAEDFQFMGKKYRKGKDFPEKLNKFVVGLGKPKDFEDWLAERVLKEVS